MSDCTIRWKHPTLGDITEYPCDRHRAALIPALDLVGIVYGYTDDVDEDAVCERCRWDAPYGEQGLPSILVRLRLEDYVYRRCVEALERMLPAERPPAVTAPPGLACPQCSLSSGLLVRNEGQEPEFYCAACARVVRPIRVA